MEALLSRPQFCCCPMNRSDKADGSSKFGHGFPVRLFGICGDHENMRLPKIFSQKMLRSNDDSPLMLSFCLLVT